MVIFEQIINIFVKNILFNINPKLSVLFFFDKFSISFKDVSSQASL